MKEGNRVCAMSQVFLSYHSKDESFAGELYRRLTRDGVQCFFEKESIPWGAKRDEVLAKGLAESDYIIPLLTPDYCLTQWSSLEQTAVLTDLTQDSSGFMKKIRPLLLKECHDVLPESLKSLQYIDVSTVEKFESHYPDLCRGLNVIIEDHSDHMQKKSLPLSISTFSKLINEHYIYVDKTKYIYHLVLKGGAFFLSRPRRFGKSLLISTLKEICQGNRDLFKGYWIYDRIQWEKYPVIHLDFLEIDHKRLGLEKALDIVLNEIAGAFDVQLHGESIAGKFRDLIRKASKDKPVIVLIDEYDKPLTDYIDNLEKAEENREILKGFYTILKAQNENIRLLFMTGVSRFSRLSVFSDLNHLVDITFLSDFVPILGYTTEEIEIYFHQYIQEYLDTVPGYSREQLFKKLKEYYNGYSWDGKTFVYNPISIMNFFLHKEFKSFWFATGTPTFLAKMARMRGLDVRGWDALEVDDSFFDKFDIANMDTDLLLFQTGYLTIKKYENETYTLSYPNREVEHALLKNLVEEFSGQRQVVSRSMGLALRKALEKNNLKGFIEKMKAFLAAIPYTLVTGDVEKYYHLVFYLVLKLAMGKVNPEHFSNRGRMDMVVETDQYIYVIEFKMESAAKALKQIQELGYYEQFLAQSKKIILLGIGFDPEKRNIADYAQREIKTGGKAKKPRLKAI